MTVAPVTIIVSGEAIAAARPRFARMGSFVRAYNPSHVEKWRANAMLCAQDAMQGRPLFTGPLEIAVTVVIDIPKSKSGIWKRDAARGLLRPITKPDIDNLVKQIDAYKGIVWHDDSQVVELHARKLYGDKPMFKVVVKQWDPVHDSERWLLLDGKKQSHA